MAIRIECTTSGLESNWIEVDEVWTRRELRAFTELSNDDFWSVWVRKVQACHVELADGGVVDDPADVPSVLDDLDIRLLRWLPAAVLTATQYLLNLGETSARLSLNGVGVAVPTRTPTNN